MRQIVQCVPNFSEGRNQNIINEIIKPLKNQAGFILVSFEPDQDYNRTVVTLLGDPEAMIEPLVSFFAKALELIDLNNHRGQHPRMGAVDVVPFIPISNITIKECVNFAKILSEKINSKLNIPIFLYAKAATTKIRESLPKIRQGEFEGMKTKIKEPNWHPDYGVNEIHPTFGTVAIGARLPLIAYNIDLATKDQKIANKIARAIRGSSGGFKYIQAGPAFLDKRGHMQVTMNILDYNKNPLYRIFEVVKTEAKRYQLAVTSSEIIGLIPRDALVESIHYYQAAGGYKTALDLSLSEISNLAIKYFGLRNFSKEKIIESYLEVLK
ncbi:MAG: glutamate formimidoyltransferase [Acholeplasmataceae bacterium]|jgi:glutamate formiminotransferase|nr:glutamate formimidoyltransferase [Acholeplasmataceae bacterium]